MTLFHRWSTRGKDESASGTTAEGDILIIDSAPRPTVAVSGRLTVNTSPRLQTVLFGRIPKSTGDLVLDLSGVTRMDTTGAATLFEILNYAYEHSVRLRLVGVTGQPRRLAEIAQLDQIFAARIGGGVSLSLLEHIGRPLLGWAQDVGALTLQCWTAIRGLPNAMPVVGKRRRWRAVLEQALAIGVRALPMASVMSLSLGFVLALQSAAELRRFGGINFVVDLVAVASTRELGALITAIAVSGRSASAISAEVGTMVVTEEMDALRVMGLNPAEFTLAPKYLGALVAMPCLTKQ